MIDTQKWIPHPERPGYLKYDEQIPLKTVLAGIVDALKGIKIDGYDADSMAEWINGPYANHWTVPDPDPGWPKGEPVVTVQAGSCEGWHVVVLSMDKDTAREVYRIKYLIDRSEVWTIAEQLAAQFERH